MICGLLRRHLVAAFDARNVWFAGSRVIVLTAGMMAGGPAGAQLGPAPGLSALTLGQPGGPARLDADGSASSLVVAGRSLAARAGDRVNILDAPYGAKCDGVLVSGAAGPYWAGGDDTAAIAAAYADAVARRKALYIPGGAGACLMRTGNPLGALSGPSTIIGDGKDLSRLVLFTDDPAGSLAGIAAPGTGYVVGDLVTVLGGAYTASAMQAKVLAVNGAGGVTAATAWGRASYTTLPPAPAGTTGGSGSGLALQIVAGGGGIASPPQGNAASRINGVTLRDFSIIGQGLQNPTQSSCGNMAIRIYSVNDLLIDGVGVDYSRCMSIAVRNSQSDKITNNRVRWSSRDGINTSSSWAVISGNIVEHAGDDGIAAHAEPAEGGALPAREGVVVASNVLTDTQGIVALGAAGVSITGNTLIRPKLRAITVSRGSGGEGATPTRAVTITGNTIVDVLTVPGDPISGAYPPQCIKVGSTALAAGGAPGVPGFPVTATGEFVPPYPYQQVNGLAAGMPTPPGLSVSVIGNSCIRTLNASANQAVSPMLFSSLGFGMIYSAAGWLDFAVLRRSVGEAVGLEIEAGAIVNLMVSGNILSGLSIAVQVDGGAQVLDGTIANNVFRDVVNYGVAYIAPSTTVQRLVFDNNLWDGDPYFTSVNRISTGTAADGRPLLNGGWVSNVTASPLAAFQVPLGIEFRRNRFRNWANLGSFPSQGRVADNSVYANAGTGVGGTLPSVGDGWEIINEDGNPASATFGQVLTGTSRDLASGCLGGRFAPTAGGVQCVALGAGLGLDPGGVLSASLPAYVSAAGVTGGGVVSGTVLTQSGGYVNQVPACFLGPPPVGGVQATCAASAIKANAPVLAAGGSGYAAGQIVRLTGVTCAIPVSLQVNTVDAAGAILTATLTNVGSCNPFIPANPVPTVAVSGLGSGATFATNWSLLAIAITNGGSGYSSPPALSFSASTATTGYHATATGTATISAILALGAPGSSGSGVASQGVFVDGSKVRLVATGAGYATPANTSWLALVQPGPVASQAIALPVAPVDGQMLRISTLGAVGGLTLSPAVSGWVNGSGLAANSGLAFGWDAGLATWLRVQ